MELQDVYMAVSRACAKTRVEAERAYSGSDENMSVANEVIDLMDATLLCELAEIVRQEAIRNREVFLRHSEEKDMQ